MSLQVQDRRGLSRVLVADERGDIRDHPRLLNGQNLPSAQAPLHRQLFVWRL